MEGFGLSAVFWKTVRRSADRRYSINDGILTVEIDRIWQVRWRSGRSD